VNFLIIGGLLAIGIVAILGAILLSRGEPRTDAKKGRPTSQTTLVEGSGPDLPNNALPPAEKSLVSAEDLRPILNGQFHELAGEIHTLHHQAWQLEQRLSTLAAMVDQVERTQNNQTSDEEETQQTPSDNIPR
jgi:hypothetical protein